MKRLIKLFFIFSLFVFVIQERAFAQFALGFETGGTAAVSQRASFKGAYYLSPKLEIPHFVFSYGYHPDLGTNSADFHSLDAAYKIDIGQSFVKPYFSAGLGYGFFHVPGNVMHGLHMFGTFGINIIVESFAKWIGVPVIFGVLARYNAQLFDAESRGNIGAAQGFTALQFLTFGANISFIF